MEALQAQRISILRFVDSLSIFFASPRCCAAKFCGRRTAAPPAPLFTRGCPRVGIGGRVAGGGPWRW